MPNKLSIIVEVDNNGAVRAIRQISDGVRDFGQQSRRAGAQADAGFSAAARGVRSISRQLAVAKTQLIAFIGVQQAIQASRAMVEVVTEYERLNAQLKTLTGSSEAAREAFAGIQQFALETPFQLTEVTQAFIMLKARGIDPTNEALGGIGNVAAAMGKDIVEVTNTALQASVGNLETMRLMGFEVVAMGDKLKITFDGVTETVDKNARALVEYFSRLGNTRFASAMADQMDTLVGALSNLEDNAQKAIVALADKSGLKGALTDAANGLADFLGELDAGEIVDTVAGSLQALVVVLVSRYTPALIEAASAQRARLAAALNAVRADQAQRASALASARAEAQRTAALVAELQLQRDMAAEAAIYGPQRAALERELTAAKSAHAAATAKLAAAEKALAASAGRMQRIGTGLLTFFGGWPGLIAGAVTAIGMWALSADDASAATEDWQEKLLRLNGEMEKLEQHRLAKEIAETEEAIRRMERVSFGAFDMRSRDARIKTLQALEDARRYLQALKAQQQEMRTTADVTDETARREISAETAKAAAIERSMRAALDAYKKAQRAAEKAARQHEALVREYQQFADELKRPNIKPGDYGFLEAANDLLKIKQLVRQGLFDKAIDDAGRLKDRMAEMARDANSFDRQALAGLAQELVRVVDEAGKGKEILAQQEVENARKRIQQLKNEAEALKHIQVEFDADASAEELQRRIQAMARDLADALVIPVTFRKEGGPIGVPGFSNGGPLPGYGGGDRILALLEGGEFVLRKEAVAAYGRGFISAINNLSLPQLPRFASGGAVGNATAPAGDVVTLNLNLGGRTHTLFGARDQVSGLVDAMRRLERAV